jgi:prepilin-type N-terminal cleavage/methylation domain-containing protein
VAGAAIVAVPAATPVNERGMTLLEMLVVVALILVTAAAAAPALRAYSVESSIVAAGRSFKEEFLKARSMAVRGNVYTAIRFERAGAQPTYSVYMDRDGDGVRSADIAAGIDERVAGPFQLTGRGPRVRVGFLPGVRAIPPDTGFLEGDPIQFGSSDILSFSPLGTATPGTFYLAGEGIQGAVRVTPGSARVRLLLSRGATWVER